MHTAMKLVNLEHAENVGLHKGHNFPRFLAKWQKVVKF